MGSGGATGKKNSTSYLILLLSSTAKLREGLVRKPYFSQKMRFWLVQELAGRSCVLRGLSAGNRRPRHGRTYRFALWLAPWGHHRFGLIQATSTTTLALLTTCRLTIYALILTHYLSFFDTSSYDHTPLGIPSEVGIVTLSKRCLTLPNRSLSSILATSMEPSTTFTNPLSTTVKPTRVTLLSQVCGSFPP